MGDCELDSAKEPASPADQFTLNASMSLCLTTARPYVAVAQVREISLSANKSYSVEPPSVRCSASIHATPATFNGRRCNFSCP